MSHVKIAFVSTKEEAEKLKQEGYCPVECAFGNECIVDDLIMDHHGEFGNLESVAIRAYREHYAERQNDPRFIVNHLDADNTFAIASLAGILPHPQNPENKRDLTDLAQTVAIMDTDAIGRNVLDMSGGCLLTVWRDRHDNAEKNAESVTSAVYDWQELTTKSDIAPLLEKAKQLVIQKRLESIKEMQTKGKKIGVVFALSGITMSGYNEWYGRDMNTDPHTVQAWKNPVIVALTEWERIRIACPNKQVAEQLFGPMGLNYIYDLLNKNEKYKNTDGWGGRSYVGGSPRDVPMHEDDLLIVSNVINDTLNERQKNLVHVAANLSKAEHL